MEKKEIEKKISLNLKNLEFLTKKIEFCENKIIQIEDQIWKIKVLDNENKNLKFILEGTFENSELNEKKKNRNKQNSSSLKNRK